MKMKIIILIIVSLSVVNHSQNLEIILSMDKVEYLECEPIYILAEVKNTGNKEISIFPISISNASSGIDLILKDKDERELIPLNDYHWLEHSLMKRITLHPGESAVTIHNINDVFANNEDSNAPNIAIWNLFLVNGSYNLQLRYNYKDFDNTTGEYSINEYFSNICEFKIIKPYLEEDLIVYREFLEAKQFHKVRDYNNYSKKLIYILENFPKNNYSLLAYNNLFPLDNIVRNIDYNKYRKKLIIEHPNSIMIISSVRESLKKDYLFKTEVLNSKMFDLNKKFNNYYQKFK